MSLAIKYAGPSSFYEEAQKYVPGPGTGKTFVPGALDEFGLVLVAELPNHEAGKKIKECTDYKNCLLSALGEKYTTEETYLELMKRMPEEVVKRDVRIICIEQLMD